MMQCGARLTVALIGGRRATSVPADKRLSGVPKWQLCAQRGLPDWAVPHQLPHEVVGKAAAAWDDPAAGRVDVHHRQSSWHIFTDECGERRAGGVAATAIVPARPAQHIFGRH